MKFVRYAYEANPGLWSRFLRWVTGARVDTVTILYESDDWGNTWSMRLVQDEIRCTPDQNRNWKYIVVPKYDALRYIERNKNYIYKERGQSFSLLRSLWLKYCSQKYQLNYTIRTLPAVFYDEFRCCGVRPETVLRVQEKYPQWFDVYEVEEGGSNA